MGSWDTDTIGICTATPFAAREKLQRERQREKSAHIKKESSQQSHDYLKPRRQLPPYSLQRRWVPPVPGPVSKLASPVGMELHPQPWTGNWRRSMETTWKLALGGFNPV